MNKNTKIWLNYTAGAVISGFLLLNIFWQVRRQLAQVGADWWQLPVQSHLFWISVGLMFVNTSLEGTKWYLLTRSVEQIPYSRAFASYLAGIALSIVTPNRVGEYPGRILFLGRAHTFRYINVSVLGVMSQLFAVYLFGLGGLIYFYRAHPGHWSGTALLACLTANIVIGIVYWRFESWLPALGRYPLLRRFVIYGRLLSRVTIRKQIELLIISLLRCTIFTAQFLFLLKCMNIPVPWVAGFCMCALFFWVMAVIPSIALTELGIRGTVSIYLFREFSENSFGVVAASGILWLLNLMIPSVAGSVLMMRMRFIR